MTYFKPVSRSDQRLSVSGGARVEPVLHTGERFRLENSLTLLIAGIGLLAMLGISASPSGRSRPKALHAYHPLS